MQFGLMAQIQIPRPWDETTEREAFWNAVEQAAHAEAVGFDYYWLTEQHFYVEIGHSAAPEMILAALSQRTSHMRLGFGVILLPLHHPFLVAERVATLDVLSRGRADFGCGRGTSPYITEGFGVDAAESREMADESLRAVMAIFKQERFEGFEGKYWTLPPRQVVPRPVQRPHPPLWVAASNIDTFAQAAGRGFGVIGVTRVLPEDMKPAVDAYWQGVRDADPASFYGEVENPHAGAFAIAACDTDDRRGRAHACAAARWYYGDNDAELNNLRFGTARDGRKSVSAVVASRSDDELIAEGIVIGGDPDSCSRGIERWADIGLDLMLLQLQVGNANHDAVMRSLDLLGEKVIPRFRGAGAAHE